MSSRPKGQITANWRAIGAVTAAVMLTVSILTSVSTAGTTQAQQPGAPPDGTPTGSALPLVPDPAECTVAPVAFADLPAVALTDPSAATPVAIPPTGGTPATPEQTAVVLATLRLQIACVNAGDIPRALALTGGRYRDRLLAGTGTPTEAQYAALATPLPRVDETVIAISAIDGAASLPDGTLTAQVTTVTTATTVNLVTLTPSPASPTGYVITDQQQVSRVTPTRTPIA